jgi:hyperosmotically inducible periplasmic protein
MKMSVPILVSVLALGGATAFQAGCAGGPLRQSTGEYVDDAATTTKVKAAMVRDPIVSALDVGVDTFKGTVQLNGFVNSEEERARAEQIASGVSGVQRVQNNLTLKAPAAQQQPVHQAPPPPAR